MRRSSDAYAGYDGIEWILIGNRNSLDNDDCLAQLLFHEFCHHLTQGPGSERRRDWGLNNIDPDDDDILRERATLRLQHSILYPYGLHEVLSPTTEYRSFYEGLGKDALANDTPGEEKALAQRGLKWLSELPWRPHLEAALEATATLAFGLDCGLCGACCREAFDVLEVFSNDPFIDRFPDLVQPRGDHYEVPRVSGHCPLLIQSPAENRWRCRHYDQRPMGCRHFTAGSPSCIDARARLERQ